MKLRVFNRHSMTVLSGGIYFPPRRWTEVDVGAGPAAAIRAHRHLKVDGAKDPATDGDSPEPETAEDGGAATEAKDTAPAKTPAKSRAKTTAKAKTKTAKGS